ncbi:MAG: 50S ribosomal protein L5 [Patescibacteria group bacterium]
MSTTKSKNEMPAAITKALTAQFGYTNIHQVPRVMKIVVHIGVGQGHSDAKILETAEQTLRRITGQQPVKSKAKKSISNFKIREGMVIGLKVTLRGERMRDFLKKLVTVALPRVRDFRGLPKRIVDKTGNATIGFKEHLVFPEIHPDEVERIHGLEVTIDTTANTREEGVALLTALGFPFQTE